jgi:hypothetical protein
MFSSLRSAVGLLSDVRSQYQYWKDLKGEEILIRTTSYKTKQADGREEIERFVSGVSGTISDVRSVPPGFLLEDVTEYIYLSEIGKFDPSTRQRSEAHEGWYLREGVRSVDQKFISFDEVSELEMLEDAENAEEPFREGGENYEFNDR